MILQTKHKIFIASLAYHPIRWFRKALGKSDRGKFTRSGLNWELDLGEVVDFMIYLRGAFEPELNRFLRSQLKPGDTVLDIGANVGAHSLTMARAVGKEGAAYAIEATEYAYSKLKNNIGLNPDIGASIRPLHCMLLAELPDDHANNDAVSLPSSWPFATQEPRHGTHQGVYKGVGAARRLTLDALTDECGLTRLDWVKIDVDGNEWDVLAGGKATLSTLKPCLIMEAALDYNEADDIKSFKNIHKLLGDLGYTLFRLSGEALPLSMEGLSRIIPRGSSMNVLALPQGTTPASLNSIDG
ncbi:MAG: FkbM family methyltransferase [Opitutales bacterium]